MAEVTEEQQQENQTPTVVVKKSLAGLWIGIVAILLVIGLAAAGFYFFQQLRASQDTENNQDNLKLIEVDKEINGLQDQLSGLQSQLANLNAEMTGKDNHFTQTLTDFSKLHEERLETARKELEASIQVLQRQLGKTRGDWLLADAEYLLTVANQRLHLVGDVHTTREALEAADQRLRESGDAAVFKVREQIAKELALLNSATVPDIVGIYAGIQHLQDAVEGLSVFLPHAGKQPEKAEPNNDLSENGHEILQQVAKQLEGYVVLRHTEQPVNAILTPEEAHFLKQQLKVRLEMIEIALVQQNDTLFASSIADAKQWLKKNFAEGQKTEQFVAELDKLAAVQIRSQYPDVSGSLKLLKDIGKLRLETDKAIITGAPAESAAQPASGNAQP
ncbi:MULTISPECIES: uroporphyrinogen-III C-methyltransferase [unclassified Methylomonas]|uniref:uroporphyrinogen-III C-methyltransferase n=1 Tax=unclassified Methylomonas TaxID=2608980 RepID=UPI00143C4A24|nr:MULTISPECIES: uroporphyrinogen-III C-methyltransferase [unclassified Methylomonas]MDT4332185.1 uroporphyrinogen-III C-methyltransferase [Methylomonas sp. MV1]NJA04267.1 enzyme of heme biosynthesis [Methylococcaceae bacterium WWC4]WGS85642.1 uroporphyrinogen-III C-methyltransferase [Methylomonas sp. UP202]